METVRVLPSGSVVFGGTRGGEDGVFRYLLGGTDSSGNPKINFRASVGNTASVFAVKRASGGKVYIAGNFLEVNGQERRRIARLNRDGSLDSTFTATGTNGTLYDLAVQADGKVVIGGDFGLINDVSKLRLARLNPNGTVDDGFDVGSGLNLPANDIAIQPDGKILVGGVFQTYNDFPRPRIVRLNYDGSIDHSFNTGTPGLNNGVNVILPLADGKILIGGSFRFFSGTEIGSVTRLNPDGSRDTTFNPGGTGASASSSTLSSVDGIAFQPDGKIVIGGTFSKYNETARGNLARIEENGLLDTTFNLSTQNVAEVASLPGGEMMVAGNIGTTAVIRFRR